MSTFDPAAYAIQLRKVQSLITEDGTDWLEAIEQIFPTQREAASVRHEIEYAYQADGGRLYDGPTDDSAAYWLGVFAKDQEDYVATMVRLGKMEISS
jgi:hypothetical protein